MPDPAKLTILKGLVNGLKTITPANGYQSNLADFDPGDGVTTPRVYRGRAFFGDGSWRAYQAGKVKLADFAGSAEDDVWGEMIQEMSLKALLGDAAKEYYKGAKP